MRDICICKETLYVSSKIRSYLPRGPKKDRKSLSASHQAKELPRWLAGSDAVLLLQQPAPGGVKLLCALAFAYNCPCRLFTTDENAAAARRKPQDWQMEGASPGNAVEAVLQERW